MKKVIPVAILLVTCFCMSGCGMIPGNLQINLPAASVEETAATETVETVSDIAGPTAAEVEHLEKGFFVVGQDGTYQPLVNKTPEMNLTISDSMVYTGLYFWCKEEVLSTIPVVKPGETDLVYVQNYALPQENPGIVLERLDDKGYTFGISFAQLARDPNEPVVEQPVEGATTTDTINYDQMVLFLNPTIFPGTSAAEVFAGALDMDAYLFTTLNGAPITPKMIPPYTQSYFNLNTGNTFTPDGDDTLEANELGMIGVFEKLTQNDEYTLGGYKGTVPVEIKLKADLHCFTTVYPYTYLDTTVYEPSSDLSKNYSVVKIPADLPEGYYILNGKQVFFLDSDVVAPAPTEATTPVE